MILNIYEAGSKLCEMLDRLIPDEELLLEKDGKVIAKIIKVPDPDVARKRFTGSGEGDFVVPEDFDDPLPKEIEDSFYE